MVLNPVTEPFDGSEDIVGRLRPGLSPRVRGSLPGWPYASLLPGSIPACTGKPITETLCTSSPQVYPRVYGEAHHKWDMDQRQSGLSPRVRGSRPPSRWPASAQRSIPACTGKPCTSGHGNAGTEVYPRVYGEAKHTPCTCNRPRGLSPRVRGSLISCPGQLRSPRSIPACTGKPEGRRLDSRLLAVYPRVYGEAALYMSADPGVDGLSPRVRGSRRGRRGCSARPRSIPACTGKPPAGCPRQREPRVYPRVYGEATRFE